jgi:hypothetical protein
VRNTLTHEGFHFLTARDGGLFSASGDEPAWTVGETRTLARKKIELCHRGYHWSPTWLDALHYCPAQPVATRIAASAPVTTDDSDGERKRVSRSRRLVAAATAGATERALRRFAAECARRALELERTQGHEPHPASWAAVEVAERLAAGEEVELAAELAAESAARSAWSAAWQARSAEREWQARSAWSAAWQARSAEREWQARRLAELLDQIVTAGVQP